MPVKPEARRWQAVARLGFRLMAGAQVTAHGMLKR